MARAAGGGASTPPSSFASLERTLDRTIECLVGGPQTREARALLIEARRLRSVIANWRSIPPPLAVRDEMLERVVQLSTSVGAPFPGPERARRPRGPVASAAKAEATKAPVKAQRAAALRSRSRSPRRRRRARRRGQRNLPARLRAAPLLRSRGPLPTGSAIPVPPVDHSRTRASTADAPVHLRRAHPRHGATPASSGPSLDPHGGQEISATAPGRSTSLPPIASRRSSARCRSRRRRHLPRARACTRCRSQAAARSRRLVTRPAARPTRRPVEPRRPVARGRHVRLRSPRATTSPVPRTQIARPCRAVVRPGRTRCCVVLTDPYSPPHRRVPHRCACKLAGMPNARVLGITSAEHREGKTVLRLQPGAHASREGAQPGAGHRGQPARAASWAAAGLRDARRGSSPS